jgi:DNA topoisomerase-1
MTWEVAADSQKHVRAIADALADDPELILATDPDREGEAISWHLTEALKKRRALKKDTPVSRVVFNAITKSAVTQAMAQPARGRHGTGRGLSRPPRARLSRRLQPVAGAVAQAAGGEIGGPRPVGRAAADRRARDGDRGVPGPRILDGDAPSSTRRAASVPGPAGQLGGQEAGPYDIPTAEAAEIAVRRRRAGPQVDTVEAKPVARNPAPPFMTSTLQQEASRKFGFGARQTMQIAQRLYEAGHITYMRTDGIDMAPEAVRPRAMPSRGAMAPLTSLKSRASTRTRPRTRRKRMSASGPPT